MSTLGADVLRLWVAATDYTSEMSCSDQILGRMSDAYRRMRNTVRFLLGNLDGFDPAQHALPADQLVQLDAWAVGRAAQLQEEIATAYREYQFQDIFQKVNNFCVLDLGGLYLDIIKDRLYTTPVESLARRSAQTAMYHIAHGMVRWLAPILSFTAEEIWQHLPGAKAISPSVFLTTWHAFPALPAPRVDWTAMASLRSAVQRELEKLREAGQIGAPLDAEVDLYLLPAQQVRLGVLGDELRFFLITSAARVHAVEAAPADAVPAEAGNAVIEGVWVRAQASAATKCVRCWHRREDVGSNPAHEPLCARCAGNLLGLPETRQFA